MSLNDNHYSKRLKCACTALATAFIGFAGIFAFAEETGAVRSAVFVESPAKALDAIVQTSGKTPVATSEEAKIGKAKKKEATIINRMALLSPEFSRALLKCRN